ncbi:MAG: hypothetical protein ACR2KJ_10585 [Jatrophihabitans sp.]
MSASAVVVAGLAVAATALVSPEHPRAAATAPAASSPSATPGYRARQGSTTQVNLTLRPGSALPSDYKRGVPHSLTVAGAPAREWSVVGWYYLAIRRADGHIASVDVNRAGTAAGQLRAEGRRIGEHLNYQRQDSVHPQFGLTYLPPGLGVDTVSVVRGNGTTYTLTVPAKTVG